MLTPDEHTELTAAGRITGMSAGRMLRMEGDQPHRLCVLLDGWAKVTSVTDTGRAVILDLLGAGDLVGEQEAIAPSHADRPSN